MAHEFSFFCYIITIVVLNMYVYIYIIFNVFVIKKTLMVQINIIVFNDVINIECVFLYSANTIQYKIQK